MIGVTKTNTILDEFIEKNLCLLDKAKKQRPFASLKKEIKKQKKEKQLFFRSLEQKKQEGKLALIAEIKKASPSNEAVCEIDVGKKAKIYEESGACAISVITQPFKFNGSLKDLKKTAEKTSIPILRKDFLFDPYQIYEAKLKGANAVLLVAMILEENLLKRMIFLTRKLGLNALVEVQSKKEIEKALRSEAKIVGVNARNLKTLEVDLSTVERLLPFLPKNIIRVAESGIKTVGDVKRVKKAGADAILVGSSIMEAKNPKQKIRELLIF